MQRTITVDDSDGHTIEKGSRVWVAVGSGPTLRPGVVENVTTKNVTTTFRWANGRETTGRRFPITATRIVEGVLAVTADEASSWAIAWVNAGRAS